MAAGDISLAILITAQNHASGVIRNIVSDLGPLGTGMLAVGAVAVGVGIAAVKMAGDFQQSVTKLYTTAGEAKSNLQMVSSGILAMSSQVGTGAQKLVEAMYWIESGGLHGAQGLVALRVAAEAAKAENANLDQVSIALAASLNAYAGSGMTAIQVMNTLTAATGQGMMTFEQLSGSLASVLPAAAKFHISLNNVTAALATMTAQGDPAAQAATHLKQVILALEAPSKIGAKSLADVGLTSARVAKEMQTSLPDALKMITDAVGKKFPEGSSAYNQAIKNIAGGSKQMMGFLELTGTHIGTFAANVGKIGSAVTAGGKDLMGWSDIQKNFNFQVDATQAAFGSLLVTLGLHLLPTITSIVSYIAPAIGAFTQWITSGNNLQNTLDILGPVLLAIGMVIMATVIPALVGMAVAAVAAGWPILAMVAAVTAAILIFQHWGSIMDWFSGKSDVMARRVAANNALASMGIDNKKIAQNVKVTADLYKQRDDLLAQLGKTHDAKQIASLESQLHKVTGLIMQNNDKQVALEKDKDAQLEKLQSTTAGRILLAQGKVYADDKVIYSKASKDKIAAAEKDRDKQLGILKDLHKKELEEQKNFFQKFVDIAEIGLSRFGTSVHSTLNQAGDGFHNFGTNIHDTLKGIVDGAEQWLSVFGSAIRTNLTNAKNQIGGFFSWLGTAFSTLPDRAVNWGANLIQGFINGIGSKIGNLRNMANQAIAAVAGILGFHSPAKEGEGRYIIQWGEGMVMGFVQGMHNKMPLLNANISHMISAPNVAYGGSSLSGSANNSQMNITVQLDSRKMMQALGVRQAKEVRIQGGYHSN